MPIIDFHCDTAERTFINQTQLASNDYHIDIKKLQEANYYAQWFAFWVNLKGLKENETPMQRFLAMYHYFIEQVNKNSDTIAIATDYTSYQDAKGKNKIAAFMSIEEGQIIGEDIQNIDKLESLGIRLMTLTWNYHNSLGAPHTSDQGLTAFGKEVVDYLNHKKVCVDVSHLSDQGIDEVLALTKKPIIASHSNARSVWAHTRNLTDKHIRGIAQCGGLVGVNFYSYFFRDSHLTTIKDTVNMIDYLLNVGGEDHVVLGTDFDGGDWELEVCNCSKMDRLIEALRKRYSSELVDKVCYKNAERFIEENM